MRKRIQIDIDIHEEGSCRGCKYYDHGRCMAYDSHIRIDGSNPLFYPVRCKECVDSEKKT